MPVKLLHMIVSNRRALPPRTASARRTQLRRVLRILIGILFSVIVAIAAVWAALALWFRLPLPELARGMAGGLFLLLGLATIIALFTRRRWHGLALFVAVFAVMLAWWSTIRPPDHGDWAPDVARQVTGTLDGDVLTLTNVREFEWRGETD